MRIIGFNDILICEFKRKYRLNDKGFLLKIDITYKQNIEQILIASGR